MVHTLNVHGRFRLRHRVQGSDEWLLLPALGAEPSQATRDLRHSSQLENWVLRVTSRPLGISS